MGDYPFGPSGQVFNTPLPANTPLTADSAVHTLLTTPVIPAGVYLCQAAITIEPADPASAFIDTGVVLGTAAGTITGQPAGAGSEPTSAFEFGVQTIPMSCVINVTQAGTVLLQYFLTGAMVALANGLDHNFGSSTGIMLMSLP
jgi:hypothetical protein